MFRRDVMDHKSFSAVPTGDEKFKQDLLALLQKIADSLDAIAKNNKKKP